MNTLLVVCFLSLTRYSIYGQFLTTQNNSVENGCPDVENYTFPENWNLHQMLGVWHEILSISPWGQCPKIVIIKENLTLYRLNIWETEEPIVFQLMDNPVNNTYRTFILQGKDDRFGDLEIELYVWKVHDKYLLLWGCTMVNNFTKLEYGTVWSRTLKLLDDWKLAVNLIDPTVSMVNEDGFPFENKTLTLNNGCYKNVAIRSSLTMVVLPSSVTCIITTILMFLINFVLL